MSTPQSGGMHYTEEDLADYFAGEMADDEAAEVERHLASCPDCVAAADEPSRRALAWSQWSPAAHREATSASNLRPAKPVTRKVVQIESGRRFRSFVLPALVAAAGVAAAVLFIVNVRDNRVIRNQAQRINELEGQTADYDKRVTDLQARITELQKSPQTAHGPGPRDRPQEPVLAMTYLPPITIQATTMGAGDVQRETRHLPSGATEFRLPLLITGHEAGTVVIVEVSATGMKPIARELTVQASGGKRQVVLDLSIADARPFLNRPVTLRVTIPGENQIGRVTLTLRSR